MDEEIRSFLDAKFQIEPIEGEDKVCSLQDAIHNNVRPGQSIHIANKAGALFFQLVREFWGSRPAFTLISPALSDCLLMLIRGGLLKKAIVSFAGNFYPAPEPNPLVQKAYISDAVEFENWSLLTLTQRLMAGALGWEFIPTRSLLGSSMEEENREDFRVLKSPFGSGQKGGLLRALHPDITLVHGLAADRSGNTILPHPLGIDACGAWASKEGVIVSVEHIVPTDYIRSHSHLVRIPSYMVKAVCEVTYGAHPGGLANNGIPQFEGYYDDYEFLTMVRDASLNEDRFMSFIHEWVLSLHNQQEYLEKLGKDRLRYLKEKVKLHSWVVETMAAVPGVEFKKESNSLERMIIAGSRHIADVCRNRGYKTILAGAGPANLAAWMAAYRLRHEKVGADLVSEIGMFGYLPRPSDPAIFGMQHLPSCKMLCNAETVLGVLAGGSSASCLGVLGAAQVDKYGNGNSTKVPHVYYMLGSGGANDVASACRESVVFTPLGKERLTEKVSYITFPGHNVKTLITDVGIFEKLNGQDTFTLTAYIPYGTAIREDEAIKGIKRLMGWNVEVAPQLKKLDLPSYEEKMMLRLFDPQGIYTKVK